MSKNTKLGKKYNPLIEEKKLFELWQEEELFNFDESSEKPLFTIDTPPPYTNGTWHIGGAIHYSSIDMIARTMRMKGYEVLFPMGLDRNGLPIETQTEKEFSIDMHKTPREEFLELCNKLLDKYGSRILTLTKRLGLSCNSFAWEKIYKTDERQYRAFTQATFIELFKKGLIYEDDRPANWDPILQTTIADAEIEYINKKHILYGIKLDLEKSSETIEISTTRPELFPSIGIIIYNPADTRYQHLNGKTAIIPIWNLKAPILPHPYAKPDFGSGLVMICSFGDQADIQIFRELQLTPTYSISLEGTLSDKTGPYSGLAIREGRKKIIEDLKILGRITKQEEITYSAPTSERSGALIEFIGMKEYYLKQLNSIDDLKSTAQEISFLPEQSRKIWLDWLDKISIDWPISRRRFYGTEIPLWYCNNCHEPIIPPAGPYYQPWKEDCPSKICPHCIGTSFTGETRILDTWMDSSNSALYIRSYPSNRYSPKLANFSSSPYIADIRAQGKEIIRTWLHYSMLKGKLLYNKPMFNHIWISGHVMDKHGYKMSKSKGNVIKPEPMIEKYGADALRLFGAMEASLGSDIRFNESKLAGLAKFLNKLFNIGKFISNLPLDDNFDRENLENSDKWILYELSETLKTAYDGYEKFDFYIPANALFSFTWDLFSNHYIELCKPRIFSEKSYSGKQSAIWTLNYCFKAILKGFSPIIPFITDYLYRALYNLSIHRQIFEDISNWDFETTHEDTLHLKEFNTNIWKLKQEKNLSLKDPIEMESFPNILDSFKEDLLQMHHIIIR